MGRGMHGLLGEGIPVLHCLRQNGELPEVSAAGVLSVGPVVSFS